MSSPKNTLEILNQTAVGEEKDIIDCMVEVELSENKPFDVFLSINETLTRVGIYVPKRPKEITGCSEEEKILHQTCHILFKNNKYYIVHFKHLFVLDGRTNGFTREDVMRMNTIINLLQGWGLYKVKCPEQMTSFAEMKHIKVLRHSEVKEQNWILKPKYNMHYNKLNNRNYHRKS